MFSRKRIVFILALSVAVSASAVTMATLTRKDRTAAAPMKVKVLRRKDKMPDKPTAAEVAAHKAENERKLKVKEVKDLPVKIMEVRNLQSDTWYKDLEIEVKNVSDKPIYHIFAWLQFPDVYGEGANRISGVTVEFGMAKYTDLRVIANTVDPHVEPGETCVLTFPEQYWGGLRWKEENTPQKVRKLELKFAVISFGDGTGFSVDRMQDYRPKKSRSHHGKALRSPPQDGCGSCSRYVVGPRIDRCWDYSRDRACPSRSTSTSATAPCTLSRPQFFDCDNDGIEECYHEEIDASPSCPGYSPTPSPTPTPEPFSTPIPTPTPTGGGGDSPPPQPCTHYYWVYYESYDGGRTWQEVDTWYAGCW